MGLSPRSGRTGGAAPNVAAHLLISGLLAAVILLTVVARLRLLNFPLERDEGEYAYLGQLILQGVPPYRLAYSMKFPGTCAAYALLMAIFGQSAAGIHLGLLLVNGATIGLVFLLGRSLAGRETGLAAAASYALLSLSPSVLGFAAHAEHFVLLPVLAGAWLLHRQPDRANAGTMFGTGALFGVGFLMKQPAACFILFGAAYCFYRGMIGGAGMKGSLLQTAAFLGGAALPAGIMLLAIWTCGVFPRFWFWCVDYARTYGTLVSPAAGFRVLRSHIARIIGAGWPLWIFAVIGLATSFWDPKLRKSGVFVAGLLLASSLAVCSGFYFRSHYFVLMLPAISLLAGIALSSATEVCRDKIPALRHVPCLIFCVALASAIYADRNYLFRLSVQSLCRRLYQENPFPEAVGIGNYLNANLAPNETIAVFGSEPEICFYAHRRSATGYIYTYELMESQPDAFAMQHEMAAQILAARPAYFVVVNMSLSWLRRPDSQSWIFGWANSYLQDFEPVAVLNIRSSQQTAWLWGADAKRAMASPYSLAIFRRKGRAGIQGDMQYPIPP